MININLMQAYELDKLSKLGISDEEILQTLRTGEVSSWCTKEPNYEFQESLALFQEGENQFLDALHGNYRIKYVTLPGIKRLLHLRFQLEETGIQDLACDEAIISKLHTMLSTNWKITQQTNGTYSIFANQLQITK